MSESTPEQRRELDGKFRRVVRAARLASDGITMESLQAENAGLVREVDRLTKERDLARDWADSLAKTADVLSGEVERLQRDLLEAKSTKVARSRFRLQKRCLNAEEAVERLREAINAVYPLASRMLSEPPETIPSNTGELVEICTIIEAALAAGKETE